MADNNTFVLFEEIKNKLETIYRELKELKEKENNSVSFPTPAISVQGNGLQDQEVLKRHELQTKERYSISILQHKCVSRTRKPNLLISWWQVS